MSTKSRESIYGSSIRASAERAHEARKVADRLACEAWNQRMLGFKGPAQPSPALGDALNAGYLYLEVRCLGCDTHQTVALNIVRRHATRTYAARCSNGRRVAVADAVAACHLDRDRASIGAIDGGENTARCVVGDLY